MAVLYRFFKWGGKTYAPLQVRRSNSIRFCTLPAHVLGSRSVGAGLRRRRPCLCAALYLLGAGGAGPAGHPVPSPAGEEGARGHDRAGGWEQACRVWVGQGGCGGMLSWAPRQRLCWGASLRPPAPTATVPLSPMQCRLCWRTCACCWTRRMIPASLQPSTSRRAAWVRAAAAAWPAWVVRRPQRAGRTSGCQAQEHKDACLPRPAAWIPAAGEAVVAALLDRQARREVVEGAAPGLEQCARDLWCGGPRCPVP